MDIRTQLLKGNSRANAENVATYVGSNPGRFRILMQCMLDVDRRTGVFRGANDLFLRGGVIDDGIEVRRD